MQYKEREWQLEKITEMDLTRTKSESRFLVDEVVCVSREGGMPDAVVSSRILAFVS